MKRYDIIIAGGGMAGLSLCYYLSKSSLRERSILLIDREVKNRNDRTWCFWESGAGAFESIIFRKWQAIEFFGTTFSGPLTLGHYAYKMLRGIDFYEFIHRQLATLPNIEVKYATIDAVNDTSAGGVVRAEGEAFLGDYVFDSISVPKRTRPEKSALLQHFSGWVITTEHDCFNAERPRIMDFRAAQQDDCRFFYVLPFDRRTALIEYTVFSQQLLPKQEYDDALREYIGKFLNAGTYQIRETESGVIPMSDETTRVHPASHVVRIGMAGGYTKPSTGYTFQRTQRHLRDLVLSLARTGKPVRKMPSVSGWVKKALDTVFLNVLVNNRHPASDLFTRLFARNDANLIFRFMDEDSSLLDDLRVISLMPKIPFVVAAIDSIGKKISHLFQK